MGKVIKYNFSKKKSISPEEYLRTWSVLVSCLTFACFMSIVYAMGLLVVV